MENKEKTTKLKTSKKDKSNPLKITKMKQGMSYSCKEKTIILNVFKYFRTELPDRCVTEIVRRTASATGCSEKSVFQFRKEEASVEGFKEPSKTKIRKNININSRDIKYDNTVRQSIRNIIYDLQYKNIPPSLSTILKHVNSDSQIPNFSLMTLRRLMFDMGFSYEKNGNNKSVLVDKPDTRYGKVSVVNSQPDLSSNVEGNIENNIQQPLIPQQTQQLHQLQPQNHHNQPPMAIHHALEPVVNVPMSKSTANMLSAQQQLQQQTPVPDSRIMATMHMSHHHNIRNAGLHEQSLMGPPMHGPPPPVSMVHKTMPMMMHPPPPRRDLMVNHGMIPTHHSNMDMHVKREHLGPWMSSLMNKN